MGTANLYGDDGTARWLTRMVPGVERADVRGRQAAWLLVLADRGAEVIDVLHLGRQARSDRDLAEPAVALPRWRSVARNTLWTVGIVLVFPQGLVPIVFNLFGVDPQVRMWFAARYLPKGQQLLAAAGFIAAGVLAIWGAEAVARPVRGSRRRSPWPSPFRRRR